MPTPWMIGYSDPYADSFTLDEVGCVLLSALRDWARDSPATAALDIARTEWARCGAGRHGRAPGAGSVPGWGPGCWCCWLSGSAAGACFT